MSAIENTAGKFLKDLPFFKGLAEPDLESFVTSARIREYRRQEQMLRQGDSADRLFVVLSGWVKLSRQTGEGDEAVVALFTRGDVFAEAAIFNGTVYPYTAEAAEDARIIEIPAKVLKEKAGKNPEILRRVMETMSREIRNQQMNNEHIALMSSAQRVGCLLLRLSSNMLGAGGTFTFPYDKSLAAAQLGMKPETFSRSLAQLKDAQVESKGTEVKVESFCALAQFCCRNCTAETGDCPGTRWAQKMAAIPARSAGKVARAQA
ncbi:MAG: Crp/Fnr family transcriptional regulator [Alphaproteobacteria bacterium]|nr:MAG: Crp/Fnr family transcriptional regulator [Alphaproteobacteria bacterium]